MKRDQLPALQFYPGDWRKDPAVQALNFFDRGVWFEILMLMHESTERGVLTLNGKVMSEEVIARVLGLDKKSLAKSLANILEFGVASKREDGAIYNRRMVRDEQIRKVRQASGSKGGNPKLKPLAPILVGSLLNQNPNQPPEDEVEDEVEDLKNKKDGADPWIETCPIAAQLPEQKTRDSLRAWATFCREKGRNFDEIQAEALMIGGAYLRERFPEAVYQAIQNGWKNIRFDSLTDKTAGPPNGKTHRLSPTEESLLAAKRILEQEEANAL